MQRVAFCCSILQAGSSPFNRTIEALETPYCSAIEEQESPATTVCVALHLEVGNTLVDVALGSTVAVAPKVVLVEALYMDTVSSHSSKWHL
jgi:hypothetical protein